MSQMQSAGLDLGPFALGQQIGDIFGAEGVVCQGILQSPGDFVRSVAFGQGEDFLHVVVGVDPFVSQLAVVGLGLRA